MRGHDYPPSTIPSDPVLLYFAFTDSPLLGDCREEILSQDVIRIIMELLENGHPAEILGGANALCALATQGESRPFFLPFFLMLYSGKLQAAILQANPILSLAISLSSDDLTVREACERALKVITGHGKFRVLHCDPDLLILSL